MNRKTVLFVIALVAAVAWPFALDNSFFTHIGVSVWMFTLLALSMNLMLRMGQLSLAHGGLMGLGAYTAALLMLRLDAPFLLAFVSAGVVGGLVALITGPILLRVKGVYFVLLTFAFGEIIVLMFVDWVTLFGGNNGLFGVPRAQLFDFILRDRALSYVFALGLAALGYLGLRWIYRSETGAVIDALHDDEELAQSLGINALRYRVVVFAISGFMAGIAGGFYASYYTFVTPNAFTFWAAVDALVMNILGGIAVPAGAVMGAILLVPLPELLRDSQEYQVLFYGLVLIFFLKFIPNGLYGTFAYLISTPRREIGMRARKVLAWRQWK